MMYCVRFYEGGFAEEHRIKWFDLKAFGNYDYLLFMKALEKWWIREARRGRRWIIMATPDESLDGACPFTLGEFSEFTKSDFDNLWKE